MQADPHRWGRQRKKKVSLLFCVREKGDGGTGIRAPAADHYCLLCGVKDQKYSLW